MGPKVFGGSPPKLSGPRQRRLDVDVINMVSVGGFCSIPGPIEFFRFLFFSKQMYRSGRHYTNVGYDLLKEHERS